MTDDVSPDDVMTMSFDELAAEGVRLAAQAVPQHRTLGPEAAAEVARGEAMLAVLQARAALEGAEVNRQLVARTKRLVWATWVLVGATLVVAVVTAFA